MRKNLPLRFYFSAKLLRKNALSTLSTFLLVLVWTLSAKAQSHALNGIVTDESGRPLQAVSVQIKGTNTGTLTDASGKFSLSVPRNATLNVSFVGYQTQEVQVGSKNSITIPLKVNAAGLNEVVVVGYGTQKKANL